jgi:zinc-ribbon domain
MAFCSNCGGLLPDTARFCPSCGAASGNVAAHVQASRPNPTPPSRNRNAGCGKAFLWVGGCITLLIAGCVGVMMIGSNATKAVQTAQLQPHKAAAKSVNHDLKASDNFRADAMTLNTTYPGLVLAASMIGKAYCVGSVDQGVCNGTLHAAGCEAIVDSDVWDALHDSQKDAYQRFSVMCAAHYRKVFGTIPRCGIDYMFEDRMGDTLMYNPIQPGEPC